MWTGRRSTPHRPGAGCALYCKYAPTISSGSTTASVASHGGASSPGSTRARLQSQIYRRRYRRAQSQRRPLRRTVNRIANAHSVGSHMAMTSPITAPSHARVISACRPNARRAITSPSATNAHSQIMPTICRQTPPCHYAMRAGTQPHMRRRDPPAHMIILLRHLHAFRALPDKLAQQARRAFATHGWHSARTLSARTLAPYLTKLAQQQPRICHARLALRTHPIGAHSRALPDKLARSSSPRICPTRQALRTHPIGAHSRALLDKLAQQRAQRLPRRISARSRPACAHSGTAPISRPLARRRGSACIAAPSVPPAVSTSG